MGAAGFVIGPCRAAGTEIRTQWVLSVGIGTAFTDTSPVTPTTPLRQLKTTFVGGVNSGSGAGRIGCR